jgi:Protein of unknown function (DUF992)
MAGDFANGARLWGDAAVCLIRQNVPLLCNRSAGQPEVEETAGRSPISGLHTCVISVNRSRNSGDVAAGIGAGVNVVDGGSNSSVLLRPLSVEGQVGID